MSVPCQSSGYLSGTACSRGHQVWRDLVCGPEGVEIALAIRPLDQARTGSFLPWDTVACEARHVEQDPALRALRSLASARSHLADRPHARSERRVRPSDMAVQERLQLVSEAF
jgi:hypothetical protein